MSIYRFKGIDISGMVCNGKIEADSYEDLKEELIKKNIALLSCKIDEQGSIVYKFFKFYNKISQNQILHFFEHINHLLGSGITLLETLKIIYFQEERSINFKLKYLIKDCLDGIEKGDSFSTVLKRHSDSFNKIIIQIIEIGERSGNLTKSIFNVITFLKEQKTLKSLIGQAAFFPIFTFGVSIFLMLGILVFVVPSFKDSFVTSSRPIDQTTKYVFYISDFIRMYNGFLVICLFAIFFLVIKFLIKKNFHYRLLGFIPYIKNAMLMFYNAHLFSILSIFIRSGVGLSMALESIILSTKDKVFQKKLEFIEHEIYIGKKFSESIQLIAPVKYKYIVYTLINIGEQTGSLPHSLEKLTEIFHEDLKKKINILNVVLQPILLFIVGGIIMFFLVTLYMPLFNLSYSNVI